MDIRIGLLCLSFFVTIDGRHLLFGRINVTDGRFMSDIYQIHFEPILEKARREAGL